MIQYKIMFPITSFKEAEIMVSKGTKEFFAGFGYGKDSLNDRKIKNANFSDYEELNKTIELIKENSGSLNLIMNFFEDIAESKETIKEILSHISPNVNLIVKDFEIIDFINKNFPAFNIHVSTINGIMNSYGITFFENNFENIKRICLERDINLDDLQNTIEGHIKNKSRTEIEILASAIGCGFSEASCKLHGIMNCSLLKTNIDSMKGESDCSYCSLSNLYKYFYDFENFEIFLKISSRDRSFRERLEHFEGLSKFIKKLENKEFKSQNDIYDFRNESHSGDCSKIICGYF